MCLCGGTAFSSLYFVQPLLPLYTEEFEITSASAALALSLPTLSLILGLFIIGPLSDKFGRKPAIIASSGVTTLLLAGMALAPDWQSFLIFRSLLGLSLGGVTAINITYLAEELPRPSFQKALGYVLAGNSIGGMSSRLMVSASIDTIGWRMATGLLAAISLLATILIIIWLPKSKHFVKAMENPRQCLRGYQNHINNRILRDCFLQGFLLMGSFVAFFNMINFHLSLPEFGLNKSQIGLVSLAMLPAAFAAALTGALASRFPSWRIGSLATLLAIAGVLMTLVSNVVIIGLGATLFAVGFFGAHTIAAGQVGRLVQQHRAKATALYQMSFYMGATIAGVLTSFIWQFGGWISVVLTIVVSLGWALTRWRKMEIPAKIGA